jgi:hypothetical protein
LQISTTAGAVVGIAISEIFALAKILGIITYSLKTLPPLL